MRSVEEVPFSTTPSAPIKEASRLLIDVASTPPMSGGEWRPVQFVTPSTTAPTDDSSLLGQAPVSGGELAPERMRQGILTVLTHPRSIGARRSGVGRGF